ncbi:MAG TPA: copper amine oxidase N-terminal domain-containing protein [Syntrophomonadaceae bacterium]|nr:copper amine oxidase N-terminal domain-containing protein [Syntrophomonadaceae bacterium]
MTLLCAAVFLVILLTGCSKSEMGYYNLQKEINNLKLYESTGEITFNLEQLPGELTKGEDATTIALIQSIFKNTSLSYAAKVDVNQQIFDEKFYLKDRITGNQKEILSITGKSESLYIKVGELVRYLKSFNNPELNKQLDQLFGGAEYLRVDSKELYEIMTENMKNSGSTGPYSLFIRGPSNIYPNLQKQQSLSQKLFDGLIQAYDQYEPGLVKQEGSKYVISLDAAGLAKTLNSFVSYSINNIDKLGAVAKLFINSLDDEEMAILGLDPAKKTDYILGIDGITAAAEAGREKYLSQFEEAIGKAEKEVIELLQGSKITATLEKLNTKTYGSAVDMTIKVKDPKHPEETFGFTASVRDTTRVIEPFVVAIPTAGVLTLTELQARMPKVMLIDVERGSYTFSQGIKTSGGTIDVKLIDGRTYLPLRPVAGVLNENVGWDPETHRAYIERNGERVDMTGIISNDRTYVKIRDFEKLGYKIDWNEELKTVVITKN